MQVDANWGLESVSCPSASFCAAVDNMGYVVTYQSGAWTTPLHLDSSSQGGLTAISCVSSTFCVAVSGIGRAVTYNGGSWSSPVGIDGAQPITSISCSSSAFCVAVDQGGDAVSYNGGSWSSPTVVDSSSAALTSVILRVGLRLRGRRQRRQRVHLHRKRDRAAGLDLGPGAVGRRGRGSGAQRGPRGMDELPHRLRLSVAGLRQLGLKLHLDRRRDFPDLHARSVRRGSHDPRPGNSPATPVATARRRPRPRARLLARRPPGRGGSPPPSQGSPSNPGAPTAHPASASGTPAVSQVKVSGSALSLRVTCSGQSGAECVITLTLTVSETIRGGKVIAVSSGRLGTGRKGHKTAVLARSSFVLRVGQARTEHLALSAAGAHLAAALHGIGVRLAITAAGRTISSRTVVLQARTEEGVNRRAH